MVQTVGQTRIQNPSYIVNRSGVYYYSRRLLLRCQVLARETQVNWSYSGMPPTLLNRWL